MLAMNQFYFRKKLTVMISKICPILVFKLIGHSIVWPARVSNCVTWFLNQFEAERIEAMEIANLLTKIKEGFSSVLAVVATI